MGHYAKMCFFKQQQQQQPRYVRYVQQEEEFEENDERETDLFIGSLSFASIGDASTHISSNEWNIEVNIREAKVSFQVDTGAQANILSFTTANYLKLNDCVVPSNVNILSFSGEKLPVKGKVDLSIEFENQKY